jgi:hypothetical protein
MTFINNSPLILTPTHVEHTLLVQEPSSSNATQHLEADSENDLTTFFDDPKNELFNGNPHMIDKNGLVS